MEQKRNATIYQFQQVTEWNYGFIHLVYQLALLDPSLLPSEF